MKKFIIGMACISVASFAFAQTGITNKMSRSTTTTTTQPVTSQTTTTTDTYTAGDVTSYQPGKTIVVKSDNDEGPVRFALGKAVRIVDRAGHVVHRALTPKDKVRVYYTGTGDNRVVERVEVED
jgi:hypothetical protein